MNVLKNTVACRHVAKSWLCKQLPLLGNDRRISKYTAAVAE
jgi:hypothetical protein